MNKKKRKVMILLDFLIALCGVGAGICHYITYGDWQVICWAIVLVCACTRSAMGQDRILRMETELERMQRMFEDDGK